MSLKTRIERLEKELFGQVETVLLENGETINVTEDEILSLIVEGMTTVAVRDNDGNIDTSHRENIELLDKAKKMKQAKPGQNKVVDLMKVMLGG
jgi:hypothetical protein